MAVVLRKEKSCWQGNFHCRALIVTVNSFLHIRLALLYFTIKNDLKQRVDEVLILQRRRWGKLRR
jgi:hypothetical protein